MEQNTNVAKFIYPSIVKRTRRCTDKVNENLNINLVTNINFGEDHLPFSGEFVGYRIDFTFLNKEKLVWFYTKEQKELYELDLQLIPR